MIYILSPTVKRVVLTSSALAAAEFQKGVQQTEVSSRSEYALKPTHVFYLRFQGYLERSRDQGCRRKGH
jgi:hypothetical protein